jgi:hypothetical protein
VGEAGRDIEAMVDGLCHGGRTLPGMDDHFAQWVARINLVCVASPEAGFPALGHCGIRRFFVETLNRAEPEEVDILEALRDFVGRDRFAWLDEMVPVSWRLENGAQIRLEYSSETDPAEGTAYSPVGEIRIRDLAGMRDHPFVCEGRVAVRLRLLDESGGRVGDTFDWPGYSANLRSRSSF